jgi:hypothetical protein
MLWQGFASHRADASRKAQLDLLSEMGPNKILGELSKLDPDKPEPLHAQAVLPHLVMPAHHDVRSSEETTTQASANKASRAEPLRVPCVNTSPGRPSG